MQPLSTAGIEAPDTPAGVPAIAGRPRSAAARTDALVVAALTLAAAVLCALFDFSELLRRWTAPWERIQLDELPAILLVLAVGLAWFAARRYREARQELARRRDAEARLGDALAHVRRLSRQHVALLEQERRGIARELHDELGQYLQVIKLDAVNLRDAPIPDPAWRSTRAGAIVESCNHLHAMLTGLLHRLRPVGLDELGLAAALEHCVATWRARLPGIAVHLASSGEYRDVPEASALAAYRAVQEALTNVARHAQASAVRVLLERIRDPQCHEAIHIEVSDDGRGWDPGSPARGLGLIGMRERVEALGGRLEVSGSPGRGARVHVWIPIADGDDGAAPWSR